MQTSPVSANTPPSAHQPGSLTQRLVLWFKLLCAQGNRTDTLPRPLLAAARYCQSTCRWVLRTRRVWQLRSPVSGRYYVKHCVTQPRIGRSTARAVRPVAAVAGAGNEAALLPACLLALQQVFHDDLYAAGMLLHGRGRGRLKLLLLLRRLWSRRRRRRYR